MLDQIAIKVSDFARSKEFFVAALALDSGSIRTATISKSCAVKARVIECSSSSRPRPV